VTSDWIFVLYVRHKFFVIRPSSCRTTQIEVFPFLSDDTIYVVWPKIRVSCKHPLTCGSAKLPRSVFHKHSCVEEFHNLCKQFHSWVCSFIRGYVHMYVVSYLGMLFHTRVCWSRNLVPGYEAAMFTLLSWVWNFIPGYKWCFYCLKWVWQHYSDTSFAVQVLG
jgi:hypothetical protein